mmetsp:Transcript_11286/g.16685  ORF Transcript_11286/g.16685 Transcript_11286/m.16685 type:complete len:200 (+) Transcript_11286:6933-7532(+)
MVMISFACTFSFCKASISFCPNSYTVSISVVFMVIFPDFPSDPSIALSICISTTSPSIISVSSFIFTPIDLLNACVNASVFDISSENISDAANMVNGVSFPNSCAIAIAIAVFPVPGSPAIKIALPAICPCFIISSINPAAFLAFPCPTIPSLTFLGFNSPSNPNPLICECAPTLSTCVKFVFVFMFFFLSFVFSFFIY